MRPLSIIIPFFKKQDTLGTVMEELKLQISPEDSIYICDDFSPGGVPDFGCKCTKVIQPPQKLDPHIYRLNTLRNLGIRESKNDAVVIIDPDCVPNPRFIEAARTFFDPSILYTGRIDRTRRDGRTSLDSRMGAEKSCWIDIGRGQGEGMLVHGGCMMLSKSRTALLGWFDTGFDGAWGYEEHEFANRCFNSGVRLYYSAELLVTHLWHEIIRPGVRSNDGLLREKIRENGVHLNAVTNYRPAVGVSVVTEFKPSLLNSCLRAVFRNNTPVKVRLCVNGDDSPEMKKALLPWEGRWAVEIVKQERVPLEKIRSDALEWAKNGGYEYLINLDNITAFQGGVINLAKMMEGHHAEYFILK